VLHRLTIAEPEGVLQDRDFWDEEDRRCGVISFARRLPGDRP
jgi:hypothetical protein